MGIAIAYILGFFDVQISIWAIITTTLLQILSNLANDYGDGIKGTDNDKRIGPERAIQSGKISLFLMRRAIILFSILSFISGVYLLFISNINLSQTLIFILLGILSIISAIKYTIGNKAYGYYGLGDVFVFLFFGLLAVLGTSFLITGGFYFNVFLPASSIGLLSVAVLNLNNMRDIENDQDMGKLTLPVKLGIRKAKIYHLFLINFAFVLMLLFVIISHLDWYIYLSFAIYILFLYDLNRINRIENLKDLDPFLKKTALKTFLFVIVFLTLIMI